MQYMVIERFKSGPDAVYQRFKASGRLAPAGLTYVASWVDQSLERCFQVMETQDPDLLRQWISAWSDLVDFEVVPVITSSEAAARVLGT